jgi:hypothetical protein
VEPNYAALIAAGRVAKDAMIRAMHMGSELRPQKTPITPGQQKAWKKLAKEFGDDLAALKINSAHDIVEAGMNALQQEADVLYSNPAVRDAYEKFLFVCVLTKQKAE